MTACPKINISEKKRFPSNDSLPQNKYFRKINVFRQMRTRPWLTRRWACSLLCWTVTWVLSWSARPWSRIDWTPSGPLWAYADSLALRTGPEWSGWESVFRIRRSGRSSPPRNLEREKEMKGCTFYGTVSVDMVGIYSHAVLAMLALFVLLLLSRARVLLLRCACHV